MDIVDEKSGISELMLNVKKQINPQGAPDGLYIIPDYLTEQDEQNIIDFICKGQWSDHMSSKRPTQHFGYRYTIKGYGGSVANKSSINKLETDWGILRTFADKIENEFPGIKIAQCLANLYYKDTAIGSHRDKETPIVFGLSLVGDINMVWTKISDSKLKYEAFVPRRSLYIMCDDAAFEWKHEIPNRTTVKYPDPDGNLTITQKKPDWYCRLSITYRHFINPLN